MTEFRTYLIKRFLETNKKDVKIQYIRDEFGYRSGVVVKIGRGEDAKIGVSLVNSNSDYEYKFVKPHQTPIWQWMIQNGIPMDIIISSNFFKKLINSGCFIGIPKFNKYVGLDLAIDNALSPVNKTVEYHNPYVKRAIENIK